MLEFEYIALICGGIGPDTWDKEVTVKAESMMAAVQKIYDDFGCPGGCDIAEIQQSE